MQIEGTGPILVMAYRPAKLKLRPYPPGSSVIVFAHKMPKTLCSHLRIDQRERGSQGAAGIQNGTCDSPLLAFLKHH